jgi:hypothetical protein
MSSPKPAPLVRSDSEGDSLKALIRKRAASQSLAQRGADRTCLLGGRWRTVTETEGRVGKPRPPVGRLPWAHISIIFASLAINARVRSPWPIGRDGNCSIAFPSALPCGIMSAMATDGNATAYSAEMDSTATAEETVKVQRLFEEIGLDVQVSATYTVRSVEVVVEAVLFLVGAGVVRVWLNAASSFGKILGDDLAHYTGDRIKAWLEQLRQARGREVTTIIQDPSIGAEILLTGDEPPKALEQLSELIKNDHIKAIPGKAAQVQYREGDGWVRPF